MLKVFDAAAELPEPAPEPWCFVSRERAGEGRGEGGGAERKIEALYQFDSNSKFRAHFVHKVIRKYRKQLEDMRE